MERRPFRHHESYFREFDEAPKKFILYEIHDINFLKELLNDESQRISPEHRIEILNYIAQSQQKAAAAVPTEYFKMKNGRFQPKHSFQLLEGSLKAKIYNHGGYVSLDIVNRGFSVIQEMANFNGIELPCLSHFIENREKVYKDQEEFWRSRRTDPKSGFLNLIRHPKIYSNQPQYIKNLIRDIQRISKSAQRPDFSKLADIIEIYTNKILELIAKYLIDHGIIDDKFYSLNGDEIMFQPKKTFIVKDIEEFIFRETQFRIKLH